MLDLGVHAQWLILSYQSNIMGTCNDFQMRIFIIAKKITFCSVYVHDLKALSSEAPPFVPLALKTLFNSPTQTRAAVSPEDDPLHQSLSHYRSLIDSKYAHNPSLSTAGPDLREDEDGAKEEDEAQRQLMKYCHKYQRMLFLEEHQTKYDIAEFDLFHILPQLEFPKTGSNAQFMKARMSVPGASENRPLIVFGDRVYLRPADDPLALEIEGIIYEVKHDRVMFLLPLKGMQQREKSLVRRKIKYKDRRFHGT